MFRLPKHFVILIKQLNGANISILLVIVIAFDYLMNGLSDFHLFASVLCVD